MKQLLWKEYRTNLIWLAILAAVSATTAAMSGSTFIGNGGVSPWITLPAVIAGLAGLNMYNSETHHNEETFLFSRPVQPWVLFAVKVAALAMMIVAGVAVAAIAFLVFIPEEYGRLVSTDRILSGFTYSLIVTGIPAIAGFLFSLAGKGTMESLAILAMAWFLLMFASRFGNSVADLSMVTSITFTLSLAGMMAYIISRQQRYSIRDRKVLYIIGLVVAILFARGTDTVWSRFGPTSPQPSAFTRWTSMSPDGSRILSISSEHSPDESEGSNVYYVFNQDGRRLQDLRFPHDKYMSLVNWVTDDTALFVEKSGPERIKVTPHPAEPTMDVAPADKALVNKQPEEFLIVLVTLKKDGPHFQQSGLISGVARHMLGGDGVFSTSSPDGTSLSPSGEWFKGLRKQEIMATHEYFVNLRTFKVITYPSKGFWWASGDTAAFRDEVGQVNHLKLNENGVVVLAPENN